MAIIPKTKTPESVYTTLLALAGGTGIIFYFLLGMWGLGILFIVLGSTTNLYTASGVSAYNAQILVNSITGEMRVIFPGINFKLPWEKPQEDENGNLRFIDLRVELSEPAKTETYASQDALMEVKYVYTIRPDISQGFGEDAGEKILIFSSFEPSAIKEKGKSLFSQLLSDYYSTQPGENLLKKALINRIVFGTEDQPKPVIKEFERKHGVEVTVRLEDSDFDKATQKFRDMISSAKSFNEAVNKLIGGGMERLQAEKVVKLMNLEGYNEKDINLNVNAPHLTNLQNVTMMGGLIDENKTTKGGKK